jgi:FkbM family methyltransferase
MFEMMKRATFPARQSAARSLCRSSMRPDHAKLSFSAFGDDLIALAWLTASGIQPNEIRYLDVGAAEPFLISNTYLMAASGGSGILVEPDPEQAEKLRTARPMDVVLNVGIAFDDRRRARLWRLTSRVYNTFSREQTEHIVDVSARSWRPEQRREIVDYVDVDLLPIDEVISGHFDASPHFLSIDTEGVNFDILQSIDFTRHRPNIICVEGGQSLSKYERLLGAHYHRVCQTPTISCSRGLNDP